MISFHFQFIRLSTKVSMAVNRFDSIQLIVAALLEPVGSEQLLSGPDS